MWSLQMKGMLTRSDSLLIVFIRQHVMVPNGLCSRLHLLVPVYTDSALLRVAFKLSKDFLLHRFCISNLMLLERLCPIVLLVWHSRKNLHCMSKSRNWNKPRDLDAQVFWPQLRFFWSWKRRKGWCRVGEEQCPSDGSHWIWFVQISLYWISGKRKFVITLSIASSLLLVACVQHWFEETYCLWFLFCRKNLVG